MTKEQQEKLNKVEALTKAKVPFETACQLLGYDQEEIRKLRNDIPDFMKELFGKFSQK